VSIATGVGGWIVAAVGAGMLVAGRRALSIRMEAVARACHELRGPLTAARLGLALGSGAGELTPARLRAIDAELGRAALALDDLADADAGGGAPRVRERRPVDVGQLVADSVEAWRASAAAAGTAVQLRGHGGGGGGGVVWGDRARLAQATGNLIANAIEHGGGPVEVRVSIRELTTRIEVSDDGPGLPAPVAELSRRARNGRGARGRGLAIAAAVAVAHGGRLAAAPSDRGARLVIELPVAPRHGCRDAAG
jgi:signal transduction histidine kinase